MNLQNNELIKNMEIFTTELINKIRIPVHLKGYSFLRTSIICAAQNNDLLNGIAKNLYPLVAEIHKTTPQKVERSIRNAIDTAWNHGANDVMQEFIGYGYGKPTNSELIATAADRVRLKFML